MLLCTISIPHIEVLISQVLATSKKKCFSNALGLLAVGSRVQTPAIATHLRGRSRAIGLTT